MSKTVFTQVNYDLGTLVKYIALGEIGLPDIQRPFVWRNSKVRDLFDSMYRGYPVGFLLFWQTAANNGSRAIGSDDKQKPPRLLIVDGQQRLTSLYAVLKNVPVYRSNFETEYIRIAFNPLEQKFEVADAAIRRDKHFIPDISVLWDNETDVFEIVENYLKELTSVRDLTGDESKAIKKSIPKLQGLLNFPFTALELAPDIDDEAVSEVFVRVNSMGTTLNQADFILTLMSVFWDQGRTDLEDFCRDARRPATGTASPFNYFIEPSPAQLLRVAVGVAFKRARLRYVYSILRGKDLETEQFCEQRRIQQFDVLRDAQSRTLNLQHWHDFLQCVRQAGFRSRKMISSENTLLFTYVFYLIGRTEYRVPEFDLRRLISRWFFMASVTGRYTSSPETTMESDLARLRGVEKPEAFVNILNRTCDVAITNDFWSVALPNDLATSSPRSPSLFAYYAALVLLEAPALFSRTKVVELLDPAIKPNRSALERHHLFPKAFLREKGITETRETNQIANFTLVEWGDNAQISETAPSEYLPEMTERFTQKEIETMFRLHGLPFGWENMDYHEFLEKRRELMARIISEGYSILLADKSLPDDAEELDVSEVVSDGESEAVEFKATLRTNLHTGEKDARMEHAVLKTLAGFLNVQGGTLVIGVADDGTPIGIESDGFENEDKMSLHLVNLVKSKLGITAITFLHAHFDDYDGHRVLVVVCLKAPSPIYVKDGNQEHFYIRTGPSTTELSPSQMQDYIEKRFRS